MWCTIPPQWNMKRFDKKATTDSLIKKKKKKKKKKTLNLLKIH